MSDSSTIHPNMIAPCGMNCALCSKYLAQLNDLDRPGCLGCRARNTACTYLLEKCSGINGGPTAEAPFCFECDQYPCAGIERMDKRYRENYSISVIENLERVRKVGLVIFTEEQYQQHRCERCGGLISVHNRKCFKCDPVTRLVEKIGKEYK